VACTHDDDDARFQQWFGCNRFLPDVQRRTDQQVQLTPQQCFGELGRVPRHHFQADVRPALVDACNDSGEQHPGRGGSQADSHEAGVPGGHAPYLPSQPLRFVGEGLGSPRDEEREIGRP
jgi:hypothetical protein